jgi:hypothetical protein
MTESLSILLRYRRPFLLVFLVCLVISGALIFQIPKKYEVRSSIEVASSLVGDHLEAIEPAPQIAKMVTDLYGPSGVLELELRGIPISPLAAVEKVKAEATGRNLFLQNQVGESDVTIAKDFQQNIIERIIKASATLVQTVRVGIQAKIDAARRNAEPYSDNIKRLRSEIDQVNQRNEELNRHLADLHAEYSDKIKRQPDPKNEQNTLQNVREIRERVAREETRGRDLSAERTRIGHEILDNQRLLANQILLQNAGERELAALSDPRSVLSPSVLPVPVATPRLALLAAAIALSLLLAFGTIVAIHKFQTDSHWRQDPRPESETSSGGKTVGMRLTG